MNIVFDLASLTTKLYLSTFVISVFYLLYLTIPDSEFDKSNTKIENQEGDYKIKLKNYPEFLENILLNHQKLYLSLSSKKSFTLNKGLIEKSLPKFLSKNKSVIASLVIFDMDLYKPTFEAMEMIKPHLLSGSIIVFDEIISNQQYPGESLALRNCSYAENLMPLRKSKYVPGAALFKYKIKN